MRQCEICGKSYIIGGTRKKLRGKYNPTSRKKKYPNLQKTKLPNGKRVLACTKCIKTISKGKAKS
jgi:ribosomal protein L28